jgi:hypothetical protein
MAFTVWGKPAVPAELLRDKEFNKAPNSAFVAARNTLDAVYQSDDLNVQIIKTSVPDVVETLKRLDAVEVLPQHSPEMTHFCSPNVDQIANRFLKGMSGSSTRRCDPLFASSLFSRSREIRPNSFSVNYLCHLTTWLAWLARAKNRQELTVRLHFDLRARDRLT